MAQDSRSGTGGKKRWSDTRLGRQIGQIIKGLHTCAKEHRLCPLTDGESFYVVRTSGGMSVSGRT
jgi:hypothetical protein